MEKEFVLPEKWCIKITEENQKIVGKYFSIVSKCYLTWGIGKFLHSLNTSNSKVLKGAASSFSSGFIRKGFEEISLEQFTKYVLKESSIPKSKFAVGDIIDTDTNGFQFSDVPKSVPSKEEVIKCDVKTRIKSNIKILDIFYNIKTESWWYKTSYYLNWISESCISLHKESLDKFIEGHWYKAIYINDMEYYLKYFKNRFPFGFSEFIVIKNGDHNYFKDGSSLSNFKSINPVSNEEISSFLPYGHPDKIPVKIKDMNVPEYIVVTKPSSGCYGDLNFCYKRFNKSECSDGYFYFKKYSNIALNLVGWRPANEKEVQNYSNKPYNVSNLMYDIEDINTNPKLLIYIDSVEEFNKVLELGIKLSKSGYLGKYCYSPNKLTYSSSSNRYNVGNFPKDYTIITIDQILPKNTGNTNTIYLLNDWVVLINNSGGSCNCIGDIGFISEINLDGSYRVTVKGNENIGNFSYGKDLRFATREEIEKVVFQLSKSDNTEVYNNTSDKDLLLNTVKPKKSLSVNTVKTVTVDIFKLK